MAEVPAVETLRAYAVAQRDDLLADLPRLDDPESVHRARTRSRRIRSVLSAFAAVTPSGRLGKDLRWLGRTLSPLRDLDIVRGRVSGPALVPHLVDHERTAALDAIAAALDGGRADRLRAALTDLGRSRTWADLPGTPLSRVAPGVLAAERSRVLDRARVAEQAGVDRPARLHDVRKAAKRLRYAAEAVGESDLAARAQEVQDLLGAGNDALLTAAWLDRAARSHPTLAEELRAESARQWAEGHVDAATYARAVEGLRVPEP